MDLSPLRALVRNLNFAAFSVPVTIEGTPDLETSGIWLTPTTEDQPNGLELRRRERTYILAIPTVEPPAHGTVVNAPASPAWADLLDPPPAPGEILRWRVDGMGGIEADHVRLRLVRAPLDES
jgi:hypothetical protein